MANCEYCTKNNDCPGLRFCVHNGEDAAKKILELEQRVKVLTDALEIELGVWKYDAKYGTSNYSRIHVDMRIRAIEKALAQTKQQPAFQEDGIRFKATVIWDHKTETIEGVLQKESKE